LGLIGVQIAEGVIDGNKLSLLVYAIPLNFYALVTMLVLFMVIYTNRDFGPMKKAEEAALEDDGVCHSDTIENRGSIRAMFYPIAVMLFSVPVLLYLSGNGNILEGSGSSSIFYSVFLTLVFIAVYYKLKGVMGFETYF